MAEVEWGLYVEDRELRWRKYREILEDRLVVLTTDDNVWSVFAQMKARQRKAGQPISDLDLLIAATARFHQLVVATLNHTDFSRIEGLAWENWYET